MPATLNNVRTVYAERAKAMGDALTRDLGRIVSGWMKLSYNTPSST